MVSKNKTSKSVTSKTSTDDSKSTATKTPATDTLETAIMADEEYDDPESLDTNIMLRMILGDAGSEKADQLVCESGKRFYISSIAFMETVYVLQKQYDFSRREIAEFLAAQFIDRKNIECHKSLLYQALDDYVTHPKLSFADCYLARKTEIEGAYPLWTLDKNLASQTSTAKLLA